jgi:hypothetical protein
VVEKDPFSDARAGFVKLDDLVDRLVLVVPLSIEERKSTLPGSEGKTYESITADVIVCDGDVTDMIEEVPMVLEGIFVSGGVIVPQVKPKLPRGNKEGGMVLGRLGQQPSQTYKKGSPAWVLNEPTDEDKVIARPLAKAYLAAQREATDPFSGAADA